MLSVTTARPPENAPVSVQLELTWRCNWRCVHCYQDDHRTEALDTGRLLRLWQELRAAGCWHVILTGGEPLVRDDIVVLVERARRAGLALTVYTNAHAIDETRAEWLADHVAAVEVTLLAGEASVHDRLAQVRGSFTRALAGIEYLRRAGVYVLVKTPLLSPALPTLSALRERLVSIGVEWATDRELASSYAGSNETRALSLTESEWLSFCDQFPEQDPARRAWRASDPGVRDGLCRAGRQHAFIDALGNVYPCLSWKAPADRLGHGRIGSILESTFSELWERAPLLRSIQSIDRASFATCIRCDAGAACQPCMAANLDEHGTLTKPAASICDATSVNLRLTKPGFVPASRLLSRGG